jgi:hypothetical protein
MLLASLVRIVLLLAPAASALAAVEAAASAAPCIERLVMYQLAASLPSPANPAMPDSEIANTTSVPPARSCHNRQPTLSIWARRFRQRRMKLIRCMVISVKPGSRRMR